MIKLSTRLPKSFHLALSGGVDSIAACHFLSKKHTVTAIYVNQNEDDSEATEDLVRRFCDKNNIELKIYSYIDEKDKSLSLEEYWREERYKIFHAIDDTVVTCHHLDDCVETWIWSSMHGIGKIIPNANKNVVRPFLQTKKIEFERYAIKNDLPFVVDNSNLDLSRTRNYIRRVIMPHVLEVNPGIQKTILKKVISDANCVY